MTRQLLLLQRSDFSTGQKREGSPTASGLVTGGLIPRSQSLRTVGLVVPDVTPEGEVCRIEFPETQVVELELRGLIELEMRARDWIYPTVRTDPR